MGKDETCTELNSEVNTNSNHALRSAETLKVTIDNSKRTVKPKNGTNENESQTFEFQEDGETIQMEIDDDGTAAEEFASDADAEASLEDGLCYVN